MDPGDRIYTLEDFKSWKVDTMKDFVTKRGFGGSAKTKDELAALCYSISLLKLPVKQTAAELVLENKAAYQSILNSCDILDPMKLYEGWQDEKTSIAGWPPTFLTEITRFFVSHGDINLTNDLLKDYKVGKAYEYYTNGWLQPVFFHPKPAAENNDKCVLRAKCLPSDRIHDDPHECWACLSREDGEVIGAWCSCFSGYDQSLCAATAGLQLGIFKRVQM